MSKYTIRNCPAYNDTPNMYDEIYGYCDNEHDIDLNKCMCENITDCVMKQIVELCKHACLAEKHLIHKSSTFDLANGILQKLGIQEVE